MTKTVIQPLDSYRLAEYANGVECYICEGDNTLDAEVCRHCLAPMALSYQARSQDVRPELIAVVGSPGAGKTVYLGMLTDMLSRRHYDLQLLGRGAFSIRLQQNTVSALSKGEFPGRTSDQPESWDWVHCQVHRSRRSPVEMIIPDISGESIIREIEQPNSSPTIQSFLRRCAGLLLLVDSSRLEEGELDQDFLPMKIISYLSELEPSRRKGWFNRPVGVVFTKADQASVMYADPLTYANTHTPGLVRICHQRLKRVEFFASSVAVCCGLYGNEKSALPVPLRIEPRGVVEPFTWLVKRVAK